MTSTPASSPVRETNPTFTVPAIYHPTLGVSDLEAARDWFMKVFRLPTFRWADTLDLSALEPGYPTDYSFFMFIKDMHFVVLCPTLHARGSLKGQTRYHGVPDGMIGIGWYTDDAVATFERLAELGFPAHDQQGITITSDHKPISSIASDILVGFTDPERAGMRHEFEELGEAHHERYSRLADPRLRPDWVKPPLDPNDPLGVIRSSHHTIATADLDRALRLYVDGAGGRVIARRSDASEGESVYVALGDAVVEFVHRADQGSTDFYGSVTLQVADLDKVAGHLHHVGLTPVRTPEAVSIGPHEAFGMRWRFVLQRPWEVQV